ncbi:MAG: coproporphyrinogen III oxidase, partial [Bacteroidota bacterium]
VNTEEKIIREVINELMCNNYVSLPTIASMFKIDLDELKTILTFEEETIKQFEKEGLLVYKENTIEITDEGKFFMRNIAASFDPKMKANEKTFSKAL